MLHATVETLCAKVILDAGQYYTGSKNQGKRDKALPLHPCTKNMYTLCFYDDPRHTYQHQQQIEAATAPVLALSS